MPGLREHWGGVLGVAFGLALLGGLIAAIVILPARPEDGNELLADWFELEAVPAGMVIAEAATLSDGRKLVRLVDPDAPDVSIRSESEPVGGEPKTRNKPVDWTALEIGPAGRRPREVLIVLYPKRQARSQLRRLFFSTDDGSSGGGGRDGLHAGRRRPRTRQRRGGDSRGVGRSHRARRPLRFASVREL